MAYADAISVRPGDTIGFKVSCDGAEHYDARIVRLLSPEAGPEAPPFRTEPVATTADGRYPARTQPLRAGSWAMVPAHPLIGALRSLSIAVLIWPTLPGNRGQAIAGTWSESTDAGFGLMLKQRSETAVAQVVFHCRQLRRVDRDDRAASGPAGRQDDDGSSRGIALRIRLTGESILAGLGRDRFYP